MSSLRCIYNTFYVSILCFNFNFIIIFTSVCLYVANKDSKQFYYCRAMLRRARFCHGKLSVRLSVTLRYSGHQVGILGKYFHADKPNLSSLSRPQHHGSTPKGTPPKLALGIQNRQYLWNGWTEDRTKVTINSTAYIKSYTGFWLPPRCMSEIQGHWFLKYRKNDEITA